MQSKGCDTSPCIKCYLQFPLKSYNYDKSLVTKTTHSARATNKCVSRHAIVSDNGMSPDRCHAIIWHEDEVFLMQCPGPYHSEIWIKIQQCVYKNVTLKMLSVKWQPYFLQQVLKTFHLCSHKQPFNTKYSVFILAPPCPYRLDFQYQSP